MIKSESSAEKLPGAAPVLDLIEAFRRSKTMFAAVELGVFDRLGKSPDDAATLGARLGYGAADAAPNAVEQSAAETMTAAAHEAVTRLDAAVRARGLEADPHGHGNGPGGITGRDREPDCFRVWGQRFDRRVLPAIAHHQGAHDDPEDSASRDAEEGGEPHAIVSGNDPVAPARRAAGGPTDERAGQRADAESGEGVPMATAGELELPHLAQRHGPCASRVCGVDDEGVVVPRYVRALDDLIRQPDPQPGARRQRGRGGWLRPGSRHGARYQCRAHGGRYQEWDVLEASGHR